MLYSGLDPKGALEGKCAGEDKTMSKSKRMEPCSRCQVLTAVRVALPCGRLVCLCIPCASNFARFLSKRIRDLARQTLPEKMRHSQPLLHSQATMSSDSEAGATGARAKGTTNAKCSAELDVREPGSPLGFDLLDKTMDKKMASQVLGRPKGQHGEHIMGGMSPSFRARKTSPSRKASDGKVNDPALRSKNLQDAETPGSPRNQQGAETVGSRPPPLPDPQHGTLVSDQKLPGHNNGSQPHCRASSITSMLTESAERLHMHVHESQGSTQMTKTKTGKGVIGRTMQGSRSVQRECEREHDTYPSRGIMEVDVQDRREVAHDIAHDTKSETHDAAGNSHSDSPASAAPWEHHQITPTQGSTVKGMFPGLKSVPSRSGSWSRIVPSRSDSWSSRSPTVTKQLIAAQSDVDLQAKDGATPNDFPADTIRTQSTPQATKRITKDPLVWREHEPINGITTPKSINSTPKSLSGRGIQAQMESPANVMRQKMLEDLRSSNSASPHSWSNSKNFKSSRHVVDRVVSHFRQGPRRHLEAASLPLRMALDALPTMVERNRGFDSM